MGKLRLRLDDLSVDSFDTTRMAGEKGTVYGNATLGITCVYPTCVYTCQNTCANTCDDATCLETCPPSACYGTCRPRECDPDWTIP